MSAYPFASSSTVTVTTERDSSMFSASRPGFMFCKLRRKASYAISKSRNATEPDDCEATKWKCRVVQLHGQQAYHDAASYIVNGSFHKPRKYEMAHVNSEIYPTNDSMSLLIKADYLLIKNEEMQLIITVTGATILALTYYINFKRRNHDRCGKAMKKKAKKG
ncbi:unnamed protein product [Strongylus vulgaris]|uniref:Uncharacterized protein n=1 Tax=Strongylus vulgaris TaxID=40348 RepID=A0A3P7IIU9_STRVU|nr:unnamed protein product [Strongylus vulgaris]